MPSGPPDPLGGGCDNFLIQAQQALGYYQLYGEIYYLFQHDALLISYNDCLNNGTNNPPNGSGCMATCERDCETHDETIKNFKINGWAVYQNIANQFWETRFVFHADVLGGIRNSLGTVSSFTPRLVTPSFSKSALLDCGNPCEGRIKTVDFRISPDWDEAFLSNPLLINWSEVDPSESTLSFGITVGVGFKIGPRAMVGTGSTATQTGPRTDPTISSGINLSYSKKGTAIVQLGSQGVFYCDPLNQVYNTGSVTFKMR